MQRQNKSLDMWSTVLPHWFFYLFCPPLLRNNKHRGLFLILFQVDYLFFGRMATKELNTSLSWQHIHVDSKFILQIKRDDSTNAYDIEIHKHYA